MVSPADSQIVSASSTGFDRTGRPVRTLRSILNLVDSAAVDLKLRDLLAAEAQAPPADEYLELSRDFDGYSSYHSDISGELQRLVVTASTSNVAGHIEASPGSPVVAAADLDDAVALGLDGFENAPLVQVEPVVRSCVEDLASPSSPAEAKRVAAARIRLLAKDRSDLRELIGESGAIPVLVPLLRSPDAAAQESAVTALLNLSLEETNKGPITAAGAIKPLVHALRRGTAVAKQNAACALLSLSMLEENRTTIGACGAIPALVALVATGTSRGKKDALTTLYRLCSTRRNKERAVTAGAAGQLVGLVCERCGGTAEKAMVVLGSLAGIEEGREAIVEAGGIQALVEEIEEGPARGRELAANTLVLLCAESGRNRGLLLQEGAVPPLVALSQAGSARAKHKAQTLLRYLREQRHEGGAAPA